mgnify:CR=1 FL=1
MIIVIDNFDSFTYNIVQYLQILGHKVHTVRNNKITIKEIEKLKPTHLVVSPGPGTPKEAGISISAIKYFTGVIPILGVCLGHQAIIEAFGGKIVRAKKIVHGKVDLIKHDRKGLFRGLHQNLEATRYHSLVGEKKSLPKNLEITATSTIDGEIMGVRDKKYHVAGVQFHPESLGTVEGMKMLENFFNFQRTTAPKQEIFKKIEAGKKLTPQELAVVEQALENIQ